MTAYDLMVLISINESVELDANEEILATSISRLASEGLITGLHGDLDTTASGEQTIIEAVYAATSYI